MKDKVVVITGAARGIGKGSAELFAQNGARVYLWDVLEEGKQAAENIVKTGGKAAFMHVSVTDNTSIATAVDQIMAIEGRIDVLINNAGITRDKTMLKMSQEDWQLVIDINLTGVFNCSKAIFPIMVNQKYGRVICTSSIVGQVGNFGQTNYVATKAAIIGMVKTWAKEFGKHNITANAVAPGFIKTDMTDLMPAEMLDKMVQEIPAKRMGLPADIAHAYMFLASDEASFINGHCLAVNGGAA